MRLPDCELELAAEHALLVGMRGEVAEIVQAAFADGANLRKCHECGERGHIGIVKLAGMMRMHARGRAQKLWPRPHQLDRGARAGERAAGDHGESNAGVPRVRHHTVTIAIEAVVCEVEADIGEHEIHGG